MLLPFFLGLLSQFDGFVWWIGDHASLIWGTQKLLLLLGLQFEAFSGRSEDLRFLYLLFFANGFVRVFSDLIIKYDGVSDHLLAKFFAYAVVHIRLFRVKWFGIVLILALKVKVEVYISGVLLLKIWSVMWHRVLLIVSARLAILLHEFNESGARCKLTNLTDVAVRLPSSFIIVQAVFSVNVTRWVMLWDNQLVTLFIFDFCSINLLFAMFLFLTVRLIKVLSDQGFWCRRSIFDIELMTLATGFFLGLLAPIWSELQVLFTLLFFVAFYLEALFMRCSEKRL